MEERAEKIYLEWRWERKKWKKQRWNLRNLDYRETVHSTSKRVPEGDKRQKAGIMWYNSCFSALEFVKDTNLQIQKGSHISSRIIFKKSYVDCSKTEEPRRQRKEF